MTELWEYDEPITEYWPDADIPVWIEQDISPADLAAIEQGGCASGAYMPAVIYHQATETMSRHGDNVLQYIQDHCGELPKPKDDESWSGIACFYLSIAVELWASNMACDPDLRLALMDSEAV